MKPHNTRQANMVRLYWAMRFGMACLWIWTAVVSWFIFPQEQSLAWLRQLGLTSHTHFLFVAACLLDLVMGIASAIFASRRIWLAQVGIVAFYTLAISIDLPEFLIHPFGPITKNLAVFGCLAYLAIMEER